MDRKDLGKITWIDPHSVDEWVPRDHHDLEMPNKVITVGRLIIDADKYVVVSLNWAEDTDEVSCSMVIPKRCIESMDEL